MPELIHAAEDERRLRPAPDAGPRPDATFRALAHVEHTLGAKPSTLRDHRSMLAEPNAEYRRGEGVPSAASWPRSATSWRHGAGERSAAILAARE